MKALRVIKIGGNIIDNNQELDAFLENFAKLEGPKILVHGGGKLATRLAEQMQVPVNMVGGRRITDAKTLDIITMVYGGSVSKTIVAKLQAFGCNAIGLSGADGNTIVSEIRPKKEIDYGYVGDIESVNTKLLQVLLEQGITPVFCALTHNEKGQLLNTNADTIASELAIGFASDIITELYYCFDKKGVLRDIEDETSLIEYIDTNNYNQLLGEGIINDGMLPKIHNCFHAVTHNVNKVCIGRSEMLFQINSRYTTIQK